MLVKVKSGENIQVEGTTDFTLVECAKCATPFLITVKLNKIFINSKETFHCPLGHGQGYYGKNEAEKLKDQLEQLRLEKNKEREELQNKWLDELGEKLKLKKQLSRVHKGVCPCCNRSFTNLQQHMKKQHPDVIIKKPN